MIGIVQPALTAAAIIAALGYTPAASNNIGAMADGSAAAPSLSFATATTTGFYKATGYNSGLGVAIAGKSLVQMYFRPQATFDFDNGWYIFGPNTACTVETTDTYYATFGIPSVNWSGTNSRPVGFNLGTWSVTITDTVTKTNEAVMGELDKMDLYQSGGPVTVNRAIGWRVRAVLPHTGVTVAFNTSLGFTDASTPDGAITTHSYITIPVTAGTGITTLRGLTFQDAPNGGSIATASSVNLNIYAGTGTGTGDITIRGANTILDNRSGAGGTVQIRSSGKTVLNASTVGVGASNNYLSVYANNTPTLQADHASSANVTLGLSSKGTSSVGVYTSSQGSYQFEVTHTAGTIVNRLQATGAATGSPPKLTAAGSDTDVDLLLVAQGAGRIRFGTFTATGGETYAGYITVKDAGGTSRKLAVFA